MSIKRVGGLWGGGGEERKALKHTLFEVGYTLTTPNNFRVNLLAHL